MSKSNLGCAFCYFLLKNMLISPVQAVQIGPNSWVIKLKFTLGKKIETSAEVQAASQKHFALKPLRCRERRWREEEKKTEKI